MNGVNGTNEETTGSAGTATVGAGQAASVTPGAQPAQGGGKPEGKVEGKVEPKDGKGGKAATKGGKGATTPVKTSKDQKQGEAKGGNDKGKAVKPVKKDGPAKAAKAVKPVKPVKAAKAAKPAKAAKAAKVSKAGKPINAKVAGEVTDGNPYRPTSAYGMLWALLLKHREKGISRADFIKEGSEITGKPEKNTGYDAAVVLSPTQEGKAHPSANRVLSATVHACES